MESIKAMQALFVDSKSTSLVRQNIETFVGCDPTIRFDCNLIDLPLSSCYPLIYAVCIIEALLALLCLNL